MSGFLKDERFRRLVNQILLDETEVVYRRKPREKMYIRRKPKKRGSLESKLTLALLMRLVRGSRMKPGDPLPPGAAKAKQILKGAKIVEEEPGPQHYALARDLSRKPGHPLAPLLNPLIDWKVRKAVEALKKLYPELREKAEARRA